MSCIGEFKVGVYNFTLIIYSILRSQFFAVRQNHIQCVSGGSEFIAFFSCFNKSAVVMGDINAGISLAVCSRNYKYTIITGPAERCTCKTIRHFNSIFIYKCSKNRAGSIYHVFYIQLSFSAFCLGRNYVDIISFGSGSIESDGTILFSDTSRCERQCYSS